MLPIRSAARALRATFSPPKASSLAMRTMCAVDPGWVDDVWRRLGKPPGEPASMLDATREQLDVAAREQHESGEFRVSEFPAAAGFALDRKAGESLVVLSKEFGTERLTASFHVDDVQPTVDRDGEEDDGVMRAVNFTVSISKGSGLPELFFECMANGPELQVRRVALQEEDGADKDDAYGGPMFSEMDGQWQFSCFDFLAERGIDDAFAEFVCAYAADAECNEYLRWLGRLNAFLSK